jgi:predicted cobalt transporter CbtA
MLNKENISHQSMSIFSAGVGLYIMSVRLFWLVLTLIATAATLDLLGVIKHPSATITTLALIGAHYLTIANHRRT